MIRVARFRALGHELPDFRVDAHDLPEGYGIDGLLGLSYLRQFNYEIRSGEAPRGRHVVAMRPPAAWWARKDFGQTSYTGPHEALASACSRHVPVFPSAVRGASTEGRGRSKSPTNRTRRTTSMTALRTMLATCPVFLGAFLMSSAAHAEGREECVGVQDTRKDVSFGDMLREETPKALALRQKLVLDTPRKQFVAATQDITENDTGSGGRKKNPAVLIKKGEPLVLLSCFREISRDVLTMDLHKVAQVPAKLLDMAPKTFVFPTEPVLWDFDAHKAFVFAKPEDIAGIPGAAESAKLEEKCAEKGLDACVVASKKVKAGPYRPDINARADQACEVAKVSERNRCMGGTAGKQYEAQAKKLDELRRKRAMADFQLLSSKFAAQ